jgi:hypothetical protein
MVASTTRAGVASIERVNVCVSAANWGPLERQAAMSATIRPTPIVRILIDSPR